MAKAAGDWRAAVHAWAMQDCMSDLTLTDGRDMAHVKGWVRQALTVLAQAEAWIAKHPCEMGPIPCGVCTPCRCRIATKGTPRG